MFDQTGKIIAVEKQREGHSKVSGNKWVMQSYVLETRGEYPRRMLFDVWGEDRIVDFAIKPGDEVKVSFNIDAREYNGKWYNSMTALNVEHVTVEQPESSVPAFDDPFQSLSAPIDLSPMDGQVGLPF